MKEFFSGNIPFSVGSGDKIPFWLDTWVGDGPLAYQFPDLFNCAKDQQAKVATYSDRNGTQVQWAPIFRRKLSVEEEMQLFSL